MKLKTYKVYATNVDDAVSCHTSRSFWKNNRNSANQVDHNNRRGFWAFKGGLSTMSQTPREQLWTRLLCNEHSGLGYASCQAPLNSHQPHHSSALLLQGKAPPTSTMMSVNFDLLRTPLAKFSLYSKMDYASRGKRCLSAINEYENKSSQNESSRKSGPRRRLSLRLK